MRARSVVVVLALGLGVAPACSGTSSIPGLGGDSDAGFCKIVRRLPEAADLLDPDSLDDPGAFDEQLRTAVDAYVADLEDLADRAPADLEKQIQVLISAVDQYKFADAIEAKEPLDEYVAEHCDSLTETTA